MSIRDEYLVIKLFSGVSITAGGATYVPKAPGTKISSGTRTMVECSSFIARSDAPPNRIPPSGYGNHCRTAGFGTKTRNIRFPEAIATCDDAAGQPTNWTDIGSSFRSIGDYP